MVTRILLISILFSMLAFDAQSQEKEQILLMTGKVLDGVVTGQDSAFVYYNLVKRNGSSTPKKLDLERVFSFTDGSGKEKIVYTMDTAIGNYFSEQEMRYYIQGEQDAMNYYRGNWTISMGLPVTAGLGFVSSGTIFAFAVPFAYLVGTSFPGYKIDKNRIPNPELAHEPAYILGFERAAKNKRLFKSLVTGLVGTAIGFAAGQVVLN